MSGSGSDRPSMAVIRSRSSRRTPPTAARSWSPCLRALRQASAELLLCPHSKSHPGEDRRSMHFHKGFQSLRHWRIVGRCGSWRPPSFLASSYLYRKNELENLRPDQLKLLRRTIEEDLK